MLGNQSQGCSQAMVRSQGASCELHTLLAMLGRESLLNITTPGLSPVFRQGQLCFRGKVTDSTREAWRKLALSLVPYLEMPCW